MLEASRGAKLARNGDTVGILPGTESSLANPYVNIPIATGLGQIRNGLVALAHSVVVVGGKAGTMSEVALAWSAKRLGISLRHFPGGSQNIAEKSLDHRRRYHNIPEGVWRRIGLRSCETVGQVAPKVLQAPEQTLTVALKIHNKCMDIYNWKVIAIGAVLDGRRGRSSAASGSELVLYLRNTVCLLDTNY